MAGTTKQTQTAPEFKDVGENVSYSVSGDELTIKIDLSHRGGLSASGKTKRVATTNGNKQVDGTEVIVGINAYVYANPK